MRNSVTRAKKGDGRRPRISVSLTEEDYIWIEQMAGSSESLSSALSRLVTAARVSGFSIDPVQSADRLVAFKKYLDGKKRNKLAKELSDLLADFLKQ